MPTISGTNTIGANGTLNVLQGQQYEFMPFDGTVEFAAMAAATGLTLAIFSGPDILQQPGGICPFLANAFPKYPDDYHWEDEAAHGDRLNLTFTNSTAGGIVVNWVVKISPA